MLFYKKIKKLPQKRASRSGGLRVSHTIGMKRIRISEIFGVPGSESVSIGYVISRSIFGSVPCRYPGLGYPDRYHDPARIWIWIRSRQNN